MSEWKFPVEAGHIVMFARSIGDPNPVYYDEDQAKEAGAVGIVAPPTFIQASAQFNPDYPLRPKIGQPWFGSGKEPTGVQRTRSSSGEGGGGGVGLHAEQHYEYHRPIRPGDVLTPTNKEGRSWSARGARATCSSQKA